MEVRAPQDGNTQFLKRVTSATVHVCLLLLLMAWVVYIVRPLIVPVLWATVLAVSLAPLHARFQRTLGGRNRLSAGLITVAALAMLLVPSALFFGSLSEGVFKLASGLRDGSITVPQPVESVAEWPVVGEKLALVWAEISEDTAAAAREYAPQLEAIATRLLSAVAGIAKGTLGFAFAIILAGVFLAIGARGTGLAEAVAVRLLGTRGRTLVATTAGTIRSVAQGVLGVAVIQALMVGVGLLLVGVPGAGLWTLLVLILAIMQLPPLLVTAPIIVYVFSSESTGVAVVFAIWTVIASGSDAFLKPLFLGRGMEIPMLVILIGAIGGMLAAGILGLFLGASVLAVAHTLFMAWLREDDVGQSDVGEGEPAPVP